MNNVAILQKEKICRNLGNSIRIELKHRNIKSKQVAETAGISRPTLWKIENGAPSVAIGSYLDVLLVLGIENKLLNSHIGEFV